MWYKVVGNNTEYKLHAKNKYDAWWCAISEIKYGLSNNTAIFTIKEC